jgi:hypothetical protein
MKALIANPVGAAVLATLLGGIAVAGCVRGLLRQPGR